MALASSNRLINTMVRKLQYCPVTGNMPTEMTQEAFDAACEQCRRNQQGTGYLRSKRKIIETWCDTCQGRKKPKGLRIITSKKALEKWFAEQRRRAA